MEAPNTLLHCNSQFLAHDSFRTVIGQLEVVDASHDTREIIVGFEGSLVRLADNSKSGIESTEAWINEYSTMRTSEVRRSHTANGKLRASSDELQVGATCWYIIIRHDFNEVSNSSTFDVEAMVSFDGFRQG